MLAMDDALLNQLSALSIESKQALLAMLRQEDAESLLNEKATIGREFYLGEDSNSAADFQDTEYTSDDYAADQHDDLPPTPLPLPPVRYGSRPAPHGWEHPTSVPLVDPSSRSSSPTPMAVPPVGAPKTHLYPTSSLPNRVLPSRYVVHGSQITEEAEEYALQTATSAASSASASSKHSWGPLRNAHSSLQPTIELSGTSGTDVDMHAGPPDRQRRGRSSKPLHSYPVVTYSQAARTRNSISIADPPAWLNKAPEVLARGQGLARGRQNPRGLALGQAFEQLQHHWEGPGREELGVWAQAGPWVPGAVPQGHNSVGRASDVGSITRPASSQAMMQRRYSMSCGPPQSMVVAVRHEYGHNRDGHVNKVVPLQLGPVQVVHQGSTQQGSTQQDGTHPQAVRPMIKHPGDDLPEVIITQEAQRTQASFVNERRPTAVSFTSRFARKFLK